MKNPSYCLRVSADGRNFEISTVDGFQVEFDEDCRVSLEFLRVIRGEGEVL